MIDKKRVPIRRRVMRMVLFISLAALLATSIVGTFSMLRIREMSKEALVLRMESNLKNITTDKAALANDALTGYKKQVEQFASYIHRLYMNPDKYVPEDVTRADASNAGKYVMQRTLADESVSEEAVKDEGRLLSNAGNIFNPVLTAKDSVVTTIYLGTEKGQILAYDNKSENKAGVEYYNYYATEWYKMGKISDGATFTDVYLDNFGNGLTITCMAPFYNEKDEFAGVVAMDILISDLYDSVISLDMEGAKGQLVDGSGKIISSDKDAKMLDDDEGMDYLVSGRIRAGENGISITEHDIYYAYVPIESTSWKYCIRMPKSVILEPVTTMDKQINSSILISIGVAVLSIVCVVFFVYRFTQNLTKPILSLGEDAKKISGGNLEHRAKIFDNDEIGDLAVNFNDMAVSLRQYIEDLTAVTAEKERIGAELNVATQIQADMLPRIFPAFPERKEFDIYATMTPAKEVGGDFYDFFLIDDDHLGLVMADVSGKGVPAALFMVIAKTLIKNRAQMGGTPSEILSYANEQLCEGNEAELFVTVWLAIIEISTGKGMAANAGHEHPALRRKDGTYELIKYRHSPAVATMEGIRFREHEFELKPGDCLYVYTDGVTEATNAHNELFGEERLVESLNRNNNSDIMDLLINVKKDIDSFVGDAPQFDDVTMLGMQYNG